MARAVLQREKYFSFFLKISVLFKKFNSIVSTGATHVMGFALKPLSAIRHSEAGELGEAELARQAQTTAHVSFHSCDMNLSAGQTAWRQERAACRLGLYLVSCTGTADAQGHGSSITNVRVVTL